ncbi:hypothetical protein OG819_56940 [Streptomyces sp. NBC_01549]|nr:hypothetical protein [Streptomyces sp. NBC_01549]MCX4598617.1 hypothetical protein [Streptomyces sp. NBC_01549]
MSSEEYRGRRRLQASGRPRPNERGDQIGAREPVRQPRPALAGGERFGGPVSRWSAAVFSFTVTTSASSATAYRIRTPSDPGKPSTTFCFVSRTSPVKEPALFFAFFAIPENYPPPPQQHLIGPQRPADGSLPRAEELRHRDRVRHRASGFFTVVWLFDVATGLARLHRFAMPRPGHDDHVTEGLLGEVGDSGADQAAGTVQAALRAVRTAVCQIRPAAHTLFDDPGM